MFLRQPPESEAVTRLYESDVSDQGYVMNLSRLWAWRPDVCTGFQDLRSGLTKGSTLSARELAVIVCTVAASLGDSYCALAWGKRLAEASDPDTAAGVLGGSGDADISARENALAGWVRKIASHPSDTLAADVEALRTAGLSEREIFEATAFAALRMAFSTVNDALGARPDWQLAQAAPQPVREAVTFGRPPVAGA